MTLSCGRCCATWLPCHSTHEEHDDSLCSGDLGGCQCALLGSKVQSEDGLVWGGARKRVPESGPYHDVLICRGGACMGTERVSSLELTATM